MSAAAAPAPSLQLRSAHPRAGGRGTQPAPLGSRSQSHARCSALSDPEGQGQRAVYPPSPPRPPPPPPPVPKPGLLGRPAAAAGGRRGAGHNGAGAAAAGGVPRATRAEPAGTPPPRLPSAPSPLPCQWASCHRRRRRRRQQAPGRRSESRLEGVSCVPRWRSSLQVGMKKRRDWESATRLVPSLWRFYSAGPSHSASAPPPGPFPRFGGERPAARGIVGVVVPESRRGGTCPEPSGTDFGSGRRRCVATGGPARSFFRIGRRFIEAYSAFLSADAGKGVWASYS